MARSLDKAAQTHNKKDHWSALLAPISGQLYGAEAVASNIQQGSKQEEAQWQLTCGYSPAHRMALSRLTSATVRCLRAADAIACTSTLASRSMLFRSISCKENKKSEVSDTAVYSMKRLTNAYVVASKDTAQWHGEIVPGMDISLLVHVPNTFSGSTLQLFF